MRGRGGGGGGIRVKGWQRALKVADLGRYIKYLWSRTLSIMIPPSSILHPFPEKQLLTHLTN